MGIYIDKISGKPYIFDIQSNGSGGSITGDTANIIQSVDSLSGITNLDFENEYFKVWDGDKSTGFTAVTYSNFQVGATGLLSIRKTTASNVNITFPSGTISNAGISWNSSTRTLTLSGALNSFHEININQTRTGVYKLSYSDEFE